MSGAQEAQARASRGTVDGSPDDLAWLAGLVRRSALLPDATTRSDWVRVLPWLDAAARYELAATLLQVEQATRDDC